MPCLSDVPLSVLDLAPVVAGCTARAALRRTIALAQAVDQCGYTRYWLAEHHGLPGVASAAPAVLAGHVAARTRGLRVGSGGVMLVNHPPLVIAEQFGTLEALFPGRIDLGIARASGANNKAADLLRRPNSQADFADLVAELMGYFDRSSDSSEVRAVPAEGNTPEIWMLGSTPTSSRLAGTLGLRYCFAHHLKPANIADVARVYRDSFVPGMSPRPYLMLSVAAIAGDCDEHAHWLAGPTKLKWLLARRDRSVLLPTPEQADRYRYTDADHALLDHRFGPAGDVIIGSVQTARHRLEELVSAIAADELMITTRVHGQADRLRSYELLANTPPDNTPGSS